MIRSMTAFASRRGERHGTGWEWELRSVNARGLEVRSRLPDTVEGLEAPVRAAVARRLSRGSVGATLRLDRSAREGGFSINDAQLDRVLSALNHVQERAFALGVTLAQPNAADVLAQRGVTVAAAPEEADEGLAPALLADLEGVLDDLVAARDGEGAALARILSGHLDAISALVDEAEAAARERREAAGEDLRHAVARLKAAAPELDDARVAQELALLAIKGDVTEELDRLRAHVAAARALIADAGPAGRKLDFLAQEFNREANTLMSKGGSVRLTRAGLDLKAVIDQMREQVQNVE